MARPQKEGLDYFSLDVNFFSDKKIKILKARYGADGITLYLYLLCEIYNNGYYLKMDDDFEFIISDDLSMSVDKVKQVLTFLLERSLFDNKLFQSDAVLTSTGIQKRYQLMVKSRAVKNPIKVERFWLLKKEETETFIKVQSSLNKSENNASYSRKNVLNSENNTIKESKGKENKEKEIKIEEWCGEFENSELESAFKLFLSCRKANGQNLNNEQIKLLREELTALSDQDQERIAIVKKAAVSNWKSFYPVKKKPMREEQRKAATNKFNNFHQRDYDFEELEKQLLNADQIKIEGEINE